MREQGQEEEEEEYPSFIGYSAVERRGEERTEAVNDLCLLLLA